MVYYIINVQGHALIQLEVREGGMRAAYTAYYGLMRGFPNDHVTIHEIAKNLSTGKLSVKLLKPKPHEAG
jgi:hypothetical protein